MKKLKLKSNDLECQSCEILIKQALEELDGIHSAKANHRKGTIDVEFDEKIINSAVIKVVIKREGFGVE